jgi:hypothetical protein
MHLGHEIIRGVLARRTFLVTGGAGLLGLQLSQSTEPAAQARAPAAPGRGKKARSTILFWLSGGASHIDTWDLKPNAPAEYRGEFKPIRTSAPGVRFCEHLPRLARQAHHLAVINSLGHFGRGTGDHHAGYYYNLTGQAPDPSFRALLNNRKPLASDWPFMGSVVAYKRPPHSFLPQLVTLPQKPGFPEYTRPGQFAARLGLDYDPLYVTGSRQRPLDFAVPALSLHGDVTVQRLLGRRQLLRAIDASAGDLEKRAVSARYTRHQEKAFSLLSSPQSKAAFDVRREPAAVRAAYGETVNGMSLLMARRLVEAGVPFVTVFWKEDPKLDAPCKSGGGWDTHGNNFGCLRRHLLPEFDRCFAALIEDLHQRGLLEETLVLVNSEMGRQPRVGDPRSGGVKGAGRDHWTNCMSVLIAGGGVRGGQVYGTSDKVGAYPADRPVAPEDVTRTVYYAMGIDDLHATDREGRPFNLLADGKVIKELF